MRALTKLILTVSILLASTQAFGAVTQLIEERYPYIEKIYHRLHQHPELAHQEKETSKLLAGELEKLGFDVTTGVGGYGIVGVLKNGKGPTVLIRTEMDALPIKEKTGLAYQSVVPNVMHACGHDLHMSVFLGTADLLSRTKDKWRGTLVMIGQPAEEVGEGAKAMIDAGLLKRFPMPDYGLALHVSSSKSAGSLSFVKGYSLANVDYVDIAMKGEGGHGATPLKTISPIELASEVALELKRFMKEEINPSHDAVASIGSIHGGTKHNIIPEEVRLQLTVRSYEEDIRQRLKKGIKTIAERSAKRARAPSPKVNYREGVPSLYNDPELVTNLLPIFEEIVGKSNLYKSSKEMYGDDFSFYGYKTGIPIFMFGLGVQKPNIKSWPRAHSAYFAPEFEKAYKTGVAAMSRAVLHLQGR